MIPRRWRSPRLLWIGAYLLLLLASFLFQRLNPPAPAPAPDRPAIDISYRQHDGVRIDMPMRYLAWTGAPRATGTPPVIFLHGSPGGASNFARLAPELAGTRDAYAPDLPGMSQSRFPGKTGSRAPRDHAAAVLAFMDAKGIDRAHIVGWSLGGAVCVHAAGAAPERIASITLLASVGAQETEGSGSHAFEHVRYAIGLGAVYAIPYAVPHFGALSFENTAPLRDSQHNFFDTDQRPLATIMRSLSTPTLILHGRNDFLSSDVTAERSHELIDTSSLVMTEHEHFLPVSQPGLCAEYIAPFLARHDTPGTPASTETIDLQPRPSGTFGVVGRWTRQLLMASPLWSALVFVGLASLISRRLTIGMVGAMRIPPLTIDLGVAIVALVFTGLAGLVRRREASARRVFTCIIGSVASPFLVFMLALVLSRRFGLPEGWFEWSALVGALWAVQVLADGVLVLGSRHGPSRLAASIQRLSRHEFWPAWLLYLCAMPALARQAVRRGPMTAGCCNPGISELPGGIGGGIVGESKAAIQNALPDHPSVLRTECLQPGDTERLLRAVRAYPVILKPDAGQRGFGVRLVRDERQAIEYAELQTVPFVVQDFHPGPHECGVFWCRDADNPDTGFIYGITGKVFPELTGDGTRSLEQLVWKHPRFRMQATTMLEKLGDDRRRVLDAGESFLLSHTGNHSQGTMFTDRADLITPELSAVINRLALGFTGPDGGGFDIGRFDIRHTSDDALKRGEGFGIVELNGLTAEASHLYDPGHSLSTSCRILSGQWDHAYRLGAWRRDSGVPAPRLAELLRALRHHASNRGAVRTAS